MVTMHSVRVRRGGFTVIELLVVLAAVGLLLAVAMPRYVAHLERAREVALKESLYRVRDAIDKYHTDRGGYPDSLADLVTHRYLRSMPVDPVTESAQTWSIVVAPNGIGILDVRSGAPGAASDGTLYVSW